MEGPPSALVGVGRIDIGCHVSEWKGSAVGMEGVQRQSELLEIVQALNAPARLAGGTHGRQHQSDKHADDDDDDQELDERKTV